MYIEDVLHVKYLRHFFFHSFTFKFMAHKSEYINVNLYLISQETCYIKLNKSIWYELFRLHHLLIEYA